MFLENCILKMMKYQDIEILLLFIIRRGPRSGKISYDDVNATSGAHVMR